MAPASLSIVTASASILPASASVVSQPIASERAHPSYVADSLAPVARQHQHARDPALSLHLASGSLSDSGRGITATVTAASHISILSSPEIVHLSDQRRATESYRDAHPIKTAGATTHHTTNVSPHAGSSTETANAHSGSASGSGPGRADKSRTTDSYEDEDEDDFGVDDLDAEAIQELELKESQFLSQFEAHPSNPMFGPPGGGLDAPVAFPPVHPPPRPATPVLDPPFATRIGNLLHPGHKAQEKHAGTSAPFSSAAPAINRNALPAHHNPSNNPQHFQTPYRHVSSQNVPPPNHTPNHDFIMSDTIQSGSTPRTNGDAFKADHQVQQKQPNRIGGAPSVFHSSILNKRPEMPHQTDIYYARREIDKLQRDLFQLRTSNQQLESDTLMKNGEISMIRKNMSKLNAENTELRDKLTKQMVIAEQSKEMLRSQLQREVDRLLTELKFKDQELSTVQTNARRNKMASTPMAQTQQPMPSTPGRQGAQFPTLASFNEPLSHHRANHQPAPNRYHSSESSRTQTSQMTSRHTQPVSSTSVAVNTDPVPDPPAKVVQKTVVVSPESDQVFPAEHTRILIGKCILAHQAVLLQCCTQSRQQHIFDQFIAAAQQTIADPIMHTQSLLVPIARMLSLCLHEEQADCLAVLLEILTLALSQCCASHSTPLVPIEKEGLFSVLSKAFELVTLADPPQWLRTDSLNRARLHLLQTMATIGVYGGDDALTRLDSIVTCSGLVGLCLPGSDPAVVTLALQFCCIMAKSTVFVEEMGATLVHTQPNASTKTVSTSDAPNTEYTTDRVSAMDHICSLLASTDTRLTMDLRHAVLTFCFVALEANPKCSRVFCLSQNLLAFVTYVHALAAQLEPWVGQVADRGHVPSDDVESGPCERVRHCLITAVRFISRLFAVGDLHFGTTHSSYLLVATMAKIVRWPEYGPGLSDMAKDLLYHVIENPEDAIAEVWTTSDQPMADADAILHGTGSDRPNTDDGIRIGSMVGHA